MKKFLSNYKSTVILLAAIIVGAIVGIVFQEKAAVLKPFRRSIFKFTSGSNCTTYILNNYKFNIKNEATKKTWQDNGYYYSSIPYNVNYCCINRIYSSISC